MLVERNFLASASFLAINLFKCLSSIIVFFFYDVRMLYKGSLSNTYGIMRAGYGESSSSTHIKAVYSYFFIAIYWVTGTKD